MATVPVGPGQQETNTRGFNAPGVYQDPESKAVLHVAHPAGADALVHLGWELKTPGQEAPDNYVPGIPAEEPEAEEVAEEEETPAPAKKPAPKKAAAAPAAEAPADEASAEEPEAEATPAA